MKLTPSILDAIGQRALELHRSSDDPKAQKLFGLIHSAAKQVIPFGEAEPAPAVEESPEPVVTLPVASDAAVELEPVEVTPPKSKGRSRGQKSSSEIDPTISEETFHGDSKDSNFYPPGS